MEQEKKEELYCGETWQTLISFVIKVNINSDTMLIVCTFDVM